MLIKQVALPYFLLVFVQISDTSSSASPDDNNNRIPSTSKLLSITEPVGNATTPCHPPILTSGQGVPVSKEDGELSSDGEDNDMPLRFQEGQFFL